MDYDSWLQSFPGGPLADPPLTPDEEAQEDFHALPPRLRAKARRMQKRSTCRRIRNREWARRQKREDRNAQVIF